MEAFNRASNCYSRMLGISHAKTANVIYCMALIYKDRAEKSSDLTDNISKIFHQGNLDINGEVSIDDLEVLLSKLFSTVDLSLCSGPQTIVALLLEVSETENLADVGTLNEIDFDSICRRCLLLVAEGYFRTAAASFEAQHGKDYSFARQAAEFALSCSQHPAPSA